MFFTLLLVTFLLALAVSFLVTKVFGSIISKIFARIIQDKISIAWQKYIRFATYVVGISGGVRIYQLERYTNEGRDPGSEHAAALQLSLERWVLEAYSTVIQTLQSLAWMYLVVFLFVLIAFAIVRGFELKYEKKQESKNG